MAKLTSDYEALKQENDFLNRQNNSQEEEEGNKSGLVQGISIGTQVTRFIKQAMAESPMEAE